LSSIKDMVSRGERAGWFRILRGKPEFRGGEGRGQGIARHTRLREATGVGHQEQETAAARFEETRRGLARKFG